jgi:uncharacterized protein
MTSLGWLYRNGKGVAQDYAKAREWYEKAASKGDAISMTSLGWLYEHGQGVVQDHAQAREWYEKASAAGDAKATALLDKLSSRNAESVGPNLSRAHAASGRSRNRK